MENKTTYTEISLEIYNKPLVDLDYKEKRVVIKEMVKREL